MKCAACGAELGADARFCGQCGAPIPANPRCASCGVDATPGTAFCTNCGAPMAQPASPIVENPAPPSAPMASEPAIVDPAPPPMAPPVAKEAPGKVVANGAAPTGLSPSAMAALERTKKGKGNGAAQTAPATKASLPAAGVEYKGVIPRFFAALIDYVIYFIILGLLSWQFGSTGASAASGVSVQFSLQGWPAAVTGLIFFLYVLLMEGYLGGTIGKLVLGMRVVNGAGRRPGLAAALVRNVMRIVDVLPFFYLLGIILVAATKRKQRVGDMVARTFVVSRRGAKGLRTAGGVAKAPNTVLAIVLLVLMLVVVAGSFYAVYSGAVILPKMGLPS